MSERGNGRTWPMSGPNILATQTPDPLQFKAAREAIEPYLDFIDPHVITAHLPMLLNQLGFDGTNQSFVDALAFNIKEGLAYE